ncbi:MAG: glycosyltransferase family 4 protein [Anaerolineae bacterium]
MSGSPVRDRLRRLRAAWDGTTPASDPQVKAVAGDLRSTEEALLAATREIMALTARVAALEARLARVATENPDRRAPLRLAYFSPLTPQATGIAGYSEMLLPALARLAEVDIYVGDVVPTDPFVNRLAVFPTTEYGARREARAYHATIYHMGNFRGYHAAIFEVMQRYPGILVLHDFLLHHFFAGLTVDGGRPGDYPWQVGYAEGTPGMAVARAALRGERPLPLFDYPLVQRALDLSQGVICHSDYVRGQVAALRPDLPTAVVGLATTPSYRRPLSNGGETDSRKPIRVITAGYLTPAKGLETALQAFALFRQRYRDARYTLVGNVEPGFDLDKLIQQTGAADAVEVRGFAPTLEEFDRIIADADVCLNLRYPTAGETSASLLRVMAVGVPAIVTDVGWFSELPDDTVIKVPAPPTAADVARSLEAMAATPARRSSMAAAAQRYVEATHSPEASARGYVEFIQRFP